MVTLAETFEMVKQAEYETKLAALQEAWGDDEVRLDLMNQALDIIKEAQKTGELPEMDEAQILDLSIAMVEETIEAEEQEKTASEETAEEAEETQEELSEEDLEKQAEALYDLGQDVGVILAENGITAEDIEKLAEEDADQLGREVARELVARYEALEDAE